MTQELPPARWLEINGVVADPDKPGIIYSRGTIVKVNWPMDYLKELWLSGKAQEIDNPPAWAMVGQ